MIRDATTADDGVVPKKADTAMGTARRMIPGTMIGEAIAAPRNANGAITTTNNAIVAGGARRSQSDSRERSRIRRRESSGRRREDRSGQEDDHRLRRSDVAFRGRRQFGNRDG